MAVFDIVRSDGQTEGLPRPYRLDANADSCMIPKSCAEILLSDGLAGVQTTNFVTKSVGAELLSTNAVTMTIRLYPQGMVMRAYFLIVEDEEYDGVPILSEKFIRRTHLRCSKHFCLTRVLLNKMAQLP